MALVGIDLGTTNSLIAYWNGSSAEIIPNIHGQHLTPSIVSILDDQSLIVGQSAKERLITHPHMTAQNFKRFMGAKKEYSLGTFKFSPIDLSSMILKSLKADAENFLGQPVNEAIISVPAYFNNIQKVATVQAAQLAGLTVERLISEPTAAALAYGIHNMHLETKFMIFDLGGGTFDVSILELFEGIIEVKSVAGDNFLGGEDFTQALINDFLTTTKLTKDTLKEKEYFSIYKQAELCKKNLTDQSIVSISLNIDSSLYEKSYTRESFEKIVSPLILRFKTPISRALNDISLTPKDIDTTILIGGATRMPIIRNTVGRMMGNLPATIINPDEAVALGAAIQGMLKTENVNFEEMILTDVCPYTLGIEVARSATDTSLHGIFSPLIERNTPIPTSKVSVFSPLQATQRKLNLKIYQGESHKVSDNVFLGNLEVTLPPSPDSRNESASVRFTYDINGILEVEATIDSSKETHRMVINHSHSDLSKEEIENRLKVIAHLKIHPRDKMENMLIITRAERLYEESKSEKRAYIGSLLENFEAILDKQDEKQIKIASSEIVKAFESLEGWFEFE